MSRVIGLSRPQQRATIGWESMILMSDDPQPDEQDEDLEPDDDEDPPASPKNDPVPDDADAD